MRTGLGVLLVAAFVMIIGGCTKRPPETWHKPGATQGDWNSDEINCRSLARRKVDREYRAEASQIGSGEYRSGATLTKTMNRYEAKKREQALFEACLKSRGFVKSGPKDGKSLK
ncbi:MAG: hypothetical protein O3B76_03045 [Proteobacteria bacterium]|nr:hypothetical protein [Pseudomonadota bacterium]MDA1022524.1 hypothetical protein [Pseudomonadota bacterium]